MESHVSCVINGDVNNGLYQMVWVLLISTNPGEYTDYDGKEEGRYGIIVMVTPNSFTLLGGGRIQDE